MISKIKRWIRLSGRFLLGLLFLISGLYAIALRWSSFAQYHLIDFILNQTWIFLWIGLALTILGFTYLIDAVEKASRRYIYIRLDNPLVSVRRKVFEKYIKSYWKQRFPQHPISSEMEIKGDHLFITTEIPQHLVPDQKEFTHQTQQDLEDLFGRVLGYRYTVHYTARFY
jgi:hypothetical protein